MQWLCGPGMSSAINGERTCLCGYMVLLLTASYSISVPFVGSRSWVSSNAKSASRSIVLDYGSCGNRAFKKLSGTEKLGNHEKG